MLLAGIAYLVKAYTIVATDPNSKDYQSILSVVARRNHRSRVVLLHRDLVHSASPHLLRKHRVRRLPPRLPFHCGGWISPTSFANRGRRLVYTEGVVVLAVITGALLIAFGGITDRLIPLFAVGAFLAFRMSQACMVAHLAQGRG